MLTQAVDQAVTQHCKRIDRVSDRQLLVRVGLPAVGLTSLLVLSGIGIGMTLNSQGYVQLRSPGESAALQWLDSEEGQLAKQISAWNPGTIQRCHSNSQYDK